MNSKQLIRAISFLLCMGYLISGYSQKHTDISVEFQAYPAGLIPGISIDKSVSSRSDVYFRLAYNWIRHGDLGKHDDERGYGYGFSIGYKIFIKENYKGFRFGIKNDVWRNSIDWMDSADSGNTKVTVIQPTLEIAYVITTKNIVISPSIAFGYEANVSTTGSPTGEGAILLLGAQFGKRF